MIIGDKPLALPTKSNPDIVVEMGVAKGKPVIKNVHYPKYFSQSEVERKVIKVQQNERSCPLCKKAKRMAKDDAKASKRSIINRPRVVKRFRDTDKRDSLPLAAVGYDAVRLVRYKRPRLVRLGKHRKMNR